MSLPPKSPPSIERLRELFSYDPTTGRFTRAVGVRGAASGIVAGSKQRSGYVYMRVDGRAYRAHRLAWLLIYGTWPNQIDHINHNRSDNRIANLRPASRALNALNRKLQVTSRSGVTGVVHCGNCRLNPWSARMTVNGKSITLGYFETKERAVSARNAAFQTEMDRRLFKVGEQYHNANAA
jgi:hypothetical protein